jgi:predicted ATPase/DNA-binding SARP family transcriptional activator
VPSLHARLLGPVHLAVGERSLSLEAWPRRTARSLLLLLLATPGHRINRDRAVDLLWPDLPPDRARTTWYQALSTLRRVLEPELPAREPSAFLTVDAAMIALGPDIDLWTDVDAFAAALDGSRGGAADEQRAALRSALALHGGDLLAEEPGAEWAIGRREELRLARQRAVLELAELDLEAGEPLASVPALETVLAADRGAEQLHRALIDAFLAAGEQERALRQYERCRQALRDDLGVEPSDATRDLIAATGKEHIPRLATPVRSCLPTPMTPLVGRDREMEAVEDLVWNPAARLVTLTGPGGVGKTRLAIEVARRCEQADAAVVFVPLAGVRTPELVLFTLGQALGVRNEDASAYLSAVLRRIGDHELLLVLDNFEHVAAAASVVARLLAGCPGLTVLTTSRTPLRLRGEHAVDVPPLALPGAREPSFAALARSEAVTLFVQRAHAAQSAFALTEQNAPVIARLCARLDCLPLAIELAAARVRVLPPRAILSRLDRRLDLLVDGPRDAPARQRTMRDAIGWSHDLLDEDEQTMFRRLGVFAGGFTLQAAEAVAQGAPSSILDRLSSLVAHSLVRQKEEADGDSRFAMLETVRAYALERLQASGEADAIQRRHAAWLIAFAGEIAPNLTLTAQPDAVDRLAAEIDNVRAALFWALAHGEPTVALRLATATFPLWFIRGMPSEGRRWLEESLAAATEAPAEPRTDALLSAGGLAFLQGDLARYVALAQESHAIAQASGYQLGIAMALFYLGVAAEWKHELDRAAARYEESLALMRQLDAPYWVALLLSNLGDINLWQGNLAAAARFADEGLTQWRALGNDWGIAQGLGTVADVASEQGDRVRAAQLYQETLRRAVALGDRRVIAGTLAGLAGLAGSTGAPRQAARLLGAAEGLAKEVGIRHLAHHLQYERVMTGIRAQLSDQVFRDERASGQALSLAQAVVEAETIVAAVSTAQAAPASSTPDASGASETAPANVIPLRARRPRRA